LRALVVLCVIIAAIVAVGGEARVAAYAIIAFASTITASLILTSRAAAIALQFGVPIIAGVAAAIVILTFSVGSFAAKILLLVTAAAGRFTPAAAKVVGVAAIVVAGAEITAAAVCGLALEVPASALIPARSLVTLAARIIGKIVRAVVLLNAVVLR
jgi:phosphohistidine swiveling domain-containing protein